MAYFSSSIHSMYITQYRCIAVLQRRNGENSCKKNVQKMYKNNVQLFTLNVSCIFFHKFPGDKKCHYKIYRPSVVIPLFVFYL